MPINKSTTKILVVDDHLLTRDMVRIILKGLGFLNVDTAENGNVALERLNDGGYALVICDWNMPQCSGLELLRAVRAGGVCPSIPFLMLTAEAYRESVREAVKAGVTDYISKPFTAGVLQQKIEKVFGPVD